MGSVQAQANRGDDGQRAFGSAQQLREIETGVVFRESGHVRDDGSIGQHRLDARHLQARHPVREYTNAARVGGDGSADGRRVP